MDLFSLDKRHTEIKGEAAAEAATGVVCFVSPQPKRVAMMRPTERPMVSKGRAAKVCNGVKAYPLRSYFLLLNSI